MDRLRALLTFRFFSYLKTTLTQVLMDNFCPCLHVFMNQQVISRPIEERDRGEREAERKRGREDERKMREKRNKEKRCSKNLGLTSS